MPSVTVNGATLQYEEHGSGSEPVVFVHGLLFNRHMFDAQVDALKNKHPCISFDLRGQGESEITADGYDMDNLAADTAALIEALDCAPCHFVGLSMGGFVGLRLALDYPHLLRSLTLLDSTADAEPKANVRKYKFMAYTGRYLGFRPLLKRLLPIMFGRDFLADDTRGDTLDFWKQQLTDNDRRGSSRAALAVIARKGVYQRLGEINTPTLIVVGDKDVATVPEKSERMHAAIKGSELRVISGAGHMSAIEKPGEVNDVLREFIRSRND